MSGAPGPAAAGLADRLAAPCRALAAAGSLLILALVVLVDLDILGRELLARPVRGVSELLALSIVAILFLQLPETLRAGRLPRSELLLDRLRGTRPRLHGLVEAAVHLAGAGLMMLLAVVSVPGLLEAWREELYVGAAGDFTAPIWPVRAVMVTGAALTAALFLARAVDALGRSARSAR